MYLQGKKIKNKTRVEYTLAGANYSFCLPTYIKNNSKKYKKNLEIELPYIEDIINLLDDLYERNLLLWYAPNKIMYFRKNGSIFTKVYKTLIKEAKEKGELVDFFGVRYYKTPLPEFIKKLKAGNVYPYRDYYLKGYIGLDSKENPQNFYMLNSVVDSVYPEIDNIEWLPEELKESKRTWKSADKRAERLLRKVIISPIQEIFDSEKDPEKQKEKLGALLRVDPSSIKIGKLRKSMRNVKELYECINEFKNQKVKAL